MKGARRFFGAAGASFVEPLDPNCNRAPVRRQNRRLVVELAAPAREIIQNRNEAARHPITTRALARLGELLRPMDKATGTRGTARGKNASGGIALEPPEPRAPTLADLGLTKKVSAVAQQLAALPDDTREAIAQRESRGVVWSPTHGRCETSIPDGVGEQLQAHGTLDAKCHGRNLALFHHHQALVCATRRTGFSHRHAHWNDSLIAAGRKLSP